MVINHILYIFQPDKMQYIVDIHKNFLIDYELCDNQCSESRALLQTINEFMFTLPTCVV